MRILIVDDNEPVRRGVAEVLSARADWEICGEANDGEQAIQKAAELLPDVVVLDIRMPGLNGLEVARRLREEVPAAKIVIMSQNDAVQLLPSVLQAGAHACVDKSRLTTDLVAGIEDVCRLP